MNRIGLVIVFCGAFSALSNAAPRKIAYQHGGNIFVADLDGTHIRKLPADGSSPAMSPDGRQVAFNTIVASTPERHIAVWDVATGKVTIFKNLPSENCYGPVWSHHGDQLAFQIRSEGHWQLGVIKSDGTGFRYLKKSVGDERDFYSFCWAIDDSSFFCQDLMNLYQFSMDGSPIKQWKIAALIGDFFTTSGTRIDISPDNQRLALDVESNKMEAGKEKEGPAAGVVIFDLEKEMATRLLVAAHYATQPQWLNNDELICQLTAAKVVDISIYRIKADGTGQRLILKDAWFPSVSRL